MKNNIKKLFIFIILFLLATSLTMAVVNGMDSKRALGGTDYENPTDNSEASELMANWLGAALVVVQVVGVGVAVIMLVVLAIKYIAAAPSDKAEIKKHAVVYVVGAIVLFAASGILGIIRTFASQANSIKGAQGGSGDVVKPGANNGSSYNPNGMNPAVK